METADANLSKLNKNERKELKRIDWVITTRILKTLHSRGEQKKTSLARLTNMGYDKCVLYLNWMELLGFVENKNHSQAVGLTEAGIVFCKTKLIKFSSEILN